MKKIVILLAMVFCLPLCVKADVAAPNPLNIDATVINPDGAKCYDYTMEEYKEVVAAGEKVNIMYNDVINDKPVVQATYKDKYCFFDPFDLSSTEDYNMEKAYKFDSLNKIYTVKEVDIYEGPSFTYKKVGTAKKNVVLSCSYFLPEGSFVYCEGEKIKGWLDANYKNVYSDAGEWTVKEALETDCGTIKAEDEFNLWLNNDYKAVVIIDGKECIMDKKDELYRLADQVNIIKLKEDAQFVDVKGKKYGLTVGEELDVLTDGFMTDPTSTFYVHFKKKNGDDVYAWGNLPQHEIVGTKEREKRVDKKETKKEKDKESKTDTKTIIIICVVTAVVIALAVIVTLVLVNKKKKEA